MKVLPIRHYPTIISTANILITQTIGMNVKVVAGRNEVELHLVMHKYTNWKDDFQFKDILVDLSGVNLLKVLD